MKFDSIRISNSEANVEISREFWNNPPILTALTYVLGDVNNERTCYFG